MFVLHLDAEQSAYRHCDAHAVKMLLEAVQLLYSAWGDCKRPAEFVLDPYKVTHSKHPVAMWVRSSAHAYRWGLQYAEALLQEYQTRYKKEHKCAPHIAQLVAAGVPPTVPNEFSGEWEGKLDTTVLATEVGSVRLRVWCILTVLVAGHSSKHTCVSTVYG